ncbi:Mitochondrial fission protein [Naganishia albida]|nr:Mitochondrial fission protein [Naganishia albida]
MPPPDKTGRRPLRDALEPVTSALASHGNTLSAVKEAIMAPFHSDGLRPESIKMISDLAPHVMNPKGVAMDTSARLLGSSQGTLSTLSRLPGLPQTFKYKEKPTATSLMIMEAVPRLLATPVDVADTDPTYGIHRHLDKVPLIQGFKATIPSSEMAKQRRRRVRGGLADEEVGGGKIGLKKLGDQARGLLTEGEEQNEVPDGQGTLVVGRKTKRRRRGHKYPRNHSISGGKELGLEELMRQADEIGMDKDNLRVRRNLLSVEVEEVAAKIDALEGIKRRLETSLMRLQEEELELEDELEGVREAMASPNIASTSAAGAVLANAVGNPNKSSRRRRGPAFLPSEHDELPKDVAFMTLADHGAPITALDFTEPYGTLVTAGQDDVVKVWDLCDGEEIGKLRGHKGTVKAIQVEDNICLSGGSDGTVHLWDLRMVEDYEERLQQDQERVRKGLDGLHIEDEILAKAEQAQESADDDKGGESKVVNDTPCIRVLEGHSKAVTALYYEDGCLVTGSSDKTIRQWDVNTGQCILTMDILWAISNPPAATIDTVNTPLSPRRPGLLGRSSTHYRSSSYDDHELLASPGASLVGLPGAGLLSAATGQSFAVPTPPYADGSWEMYQDFVGGVQFWGYALASGSGDGGVRMWDMRTGQPHRTLIGHTAPVTCLQFDENFIISGGLDKTIRTWDLRMGSIVDTLKYEFPVTALQFDSRKVIACTGENGVEVFNRTSGAHTRLIVNGHTKPAERLRFMDKYLVTGGRDGTAKVWAL